MKNRRTRLRLRLLLGAMAGVMGALAIAWLVMVMLFDRHIERRVQDEMHTIAVPLFADLNLDETGAVLVENPPSDPRFELPGSGMYWQVTHGEERLRSRSLWDESLISTGVPLQTQGWHYRRIDGPFAQRVLQTERWVTLEDTSLPILIQVAQSEKQMLAARNEFAREMALFLFILWLVLVAAAWLQVRFGLRPLSTIQSELSRLHQSPEARMSHNHPVEITPLVTAINELAEMRARDLDRAKRRAADLAHSLKTPLSALKEVSRQVHEVGATSQARALDELITATSAAVDAELARSRISAIRTGKNAASSMPLDIAERVISVVSRSPAGADIVFEVDIDADQTLPLANEDLLEILGALVENAAKYARQQVRISMLVTDAAKVLTVEDDGDGLEIPVTLALNRGARLDESDTRHQGLGLSIARDLVEATGGEISLNHASLGGLRITMMWRHQA